MSKGSTVSARSVMARNVSRIDTPESEENEVENSSTSSLLPPSRAPLNSIPDPSQLQKANHRSDFDSVQKFEATRTQHQLTLGPEKRTEILEGRAGNASAMHYSTPRTVIRIGKAQSEPNSAQSTPARTGARVSLGGGTRVVQSIGGRGVSSSSRVSRGILVADSVFSMEVPHFELDEDPSFWQDHNVQVLIRIRPLSTMERVSQGYGRCLKQESPHTLVWLGHPETRFTFDHVACETISQEQLFCVAGLPMVENCMAGYNSCMFAYGQTGSGKTYTMMGEISEAEGGLSEDCGITPRIFEYLFSRIKMEEESRRDEKLKFSCKCSFLEIYNEQITDLLEPSSTNLQLREDLVEGVYVENLTEYNVRNVNDVLKLLLKGAANRKIAATRMNSESSRSHSVFTCTIESRWERDSLTHFRFARLNLVDLAGSERPKSSGAEGDRLKEAANINKSLSTLGLVIMSLVDLAHGKQRHVPYRDSRLTFLLQDSLGGNSKTMIIANVSPSLCSANETLSTLKFAQRAKLIQNNAKVNEDASGDVTALQREIKELKGKLSSLMKNQKSPGAVSDSLASLEESSYFGICEVSGEIIQDECHGQIQSTLSKKVKGMKAILIGALRREKVAETALQKSEVEIEHINSLAREKEEDAKHNKMMLRFREEKIKQLDLLMSGSLSAQEYLIEENKSMKEEIRLLQSRLDKNPELTHFALENIRLQEQLQLYHNFYEQGERETLLAEISELRDQLLDVLEAKDEPFSRYAMKGNEVEKELEDCRNMNSSLIRELDDIRAGLGRYLHCNQTAYDFATSSSKDPEQFRQADKHSLVETMSIRSDARDDMAFYAPEDDSFENNNCSNMSGVSGNRHDEIRKELMEARSLIEAMEAEQVQLINDLQVMQKEKDRYKEILRKKDDMERETLPKLEAYGMGFSGLDLKSKDAVMETAGGMDAYILQFKLEKLSKDLEEARVLNCQYEKDQTLQFSQQRDVELVREQVETETARTILHLQEEVIALQSEFEESMSNMTQENKSLKDAITAKEAERRTLTQDWEKATLELTSFIVDGSKSIKDASAQIESIICSFPHVNAWIGDYVEKAAKVCIEKEETILLLQKSLEDAQKLLVEMELKLNSLKGAAIALSEFRQEDGVASTEEALHVSVEVDKMSNEADVPKSEVKSKQHQILEAERCAEAALAVTKLLSDSLEISGRVDINGNTSNPNLAAPIDGKYKLSDEKSDGNILMDDDTNARAEMTSYGVIEYESGIQALFTDIQVHLAASNMDFLQMYSDCKRLVHHVIREIQEIRCEFLKLKGNQSREPRNVQMFQNQHQKLQKVKDQPAERSGTASSIFDPSNVKENIHMFSPKGEYLSEEAYGRGDDFSKSTSGFSNCSSCPGNNLVQLSCVWKPDQKLNTMYQEVSHRDSGGQEMLKIRNKATSLALINENDSGHCVCCEEGKQSVLPLVSMVERAETECKCSKKSLSKEYASSIHRMDPARSFFKKFEEAHATMKEADLTLREMVKTNEKSKHVAGMWRQTGEELVVERRSLMENLEQLKSSVSLSGQENQMLLNRTRSILVDATNSITLLEDNFLQMKKGVEETLGVLYSDVLLVGREMLHLVANSRLSLEQMFSETIGSGLTLYVIYQCHVRKLIDQILDQSGQLVTPYLTLQENVQLMESNAIGSSAKDDCGGEVNGVNTGDRVTDLENKVFQSSSSLVYENLSLKKELERKEALFEGLLFDFRLLQESASNKRDIKDETDKLIDTLCQVQQELDLKTSQVDDLLVQQRKLQNCLDDMQKALFMSNSDLEQAKERIDTLAEQNDDFRALIKDLSLKKAAAEERLEEQKELVKALEKEIFNLTTTAEQQLLSSVKAIEEDLRKVTDEKDQLVEEIRSLNDKLEMAYALADEKEAIAVEARQEYKASKIYAEQKEEEVKILEISVEELESTVNVLERRVYDMDEEVGRHRKIRDSLETELQALRQRLLKVENLTDKVVTTNVGAEEYEGQASRSKELQEAHYQIHVLEKEVAELNKEIKQLKEYISEILLHSEAQATGYQDKYKTLEAMVHDFKVDVSSSSAAGAASHKTEKSSTRTRGSGSPFRCIAGLVQQMNLEKDQELTMARLRIEELESLLAAKQKEVCTLNARIAAAESMTHDVIRDLLGVKMDITNYADLIDRYQVQRAVEEAHQHAEEILSKTQEIINLKRHIDALIEERESCILDMKQKEADILATQITLEQLQERVQLLSAQNEMLKVDKTDLLRRVAELDQTVKTLVDAQASHQPVQQAPRDHTMSFKLIDTDYSRRLEHAQKLLSHANDELTKYRKTSSNHPSVRTQGQSSRTRYR